MEENTEHLNENVYFVNQLYRDFLLPTILGEDDTSVLYWAGKRIARHYDLSSFEDLADFFNHAEFGTITKVKERRTAIIYELSGQTVIDRLGSKSNEFSLEAGMIAETLERSNGQKTECEVAIMTKDQKVQFTARFN